MPIRRSLAAVAALALGLGGAAVAVAPAYAASLVVTSEADSGPGSLRQAVADSGEGDTISFAADVDQILLLTGITIPHSLTIDGPGSASLTIARGAGGNFSLLDFAPTAADQDLVVEGLTVDGRIYPAQTPAGVNFSLIHAGAGTSSARDVTLRDVALTGNESGIGAGLGAYQVVGDILIEDSAFAGLTAIEGGAIGLESTADVVVRRSVFVDNVANGGAGAGGGAILAKVGVDSLTIEDSTFDGNRSSSGGGAVSVLSDPLGTLTPVTVSGSQFLHNDAEGGGGLAVSYGGKLTVSDTAFDDNGATSVGGGVFFDHVTDPEFTDVTFTANHSEGDGGGAMAFALISGGLTVRDARFEGNSAFDFGGAVYSNAPDADIAITGTSFVENQAGAGGALAFGTLSSTFDLADSVLRGNTAGDEGGAIWVETIAGQATIVRSTIAENGFGTLGGGLYVDEVLEGAGLLIDSSTFSAQDAGGSQQGFSVAIADLEGSFEVVNSTFDETVNGGDGAAFAFDNLFGALLVHHSTVRGPGGFWIASLATLDAVVSHSIVESTSDAAAIVVTNSSEDAEVGVEWSILDTAIGDATVDLGGNRFSTDPLLGALAANGGPTSTRLPLPGSPAINAGQTSAIPDQPQFDQRGSGFPRIVDGRIDIGAVEVIPTLAATGGTVAWWAVVAGIVVILLGAAAIVVTRLRRRGS